MILPLNYDTYWLWINACNLILIKHTKLFFLSDEITYNRQALYWVGRLSLVVLCSCAQPGMELVCCVQSCWSLKDKCWVHWEALTSSGLKEFFWLLHFENRELKESSSIYSCSWHQWKSISPLPFFSFQEQKMESISQKFDKKNKCNFALGSLNYLHVTSEAFRVSQQSLDSACRTLTWWCWRERLFRVYSPRHLLIGHGLEVSRVSTYLYFFLVCLDLCLFTRWLMPHEKKPRGCFISCLSLLQLN